MSSLEHTTSYPQAFDKSSASRRHKWRMFYDALARYIFGIGGISVIIAIVLIFFYLFYVVFPLFKPASMEQTSSFEIPAASAGKTLYMAMEEQAEIGVRFTDNAHVVFFRIANGSVISDTPLDIPAGTTVTSFATGISSSAIVAYGLSNGQALVLRHAYKVTYPNDVRKITPSIEYPLGDKLITLDGKGHSLVKLAVQSNDDNATVVAATDDTRLLLTSFTKETSFLDDSVTLVQQDMELPHTLSRIAYILLNQEQRFLYVVDATDELAFFDITNKEQPRLIQHEQLVADNHRQITSIRFLTGSISLIVGQSDGTLVQWFPVRDEQNHVTLRRIRSFDSQQAPITGIAAEYGRKGFLTADARGQIGIYHSTAHRNLLIKPVSDTALYHLAISPRADMALAEDETGQLHAWHIDNEHPEVSWSSLWGKVWYENYKEPKYIWQSSAATNDFEPKFSLTPISFGTLKAAFYAMLFAVPLSILGAIYAAHFMVPRMRRVIKPSIEIMEALPTVILGFLAGLWLAPFIETHMPGIFSLLLLMPIAILICAFVWQQLPSGIRYAIPDGWEAALLIPVILLVGWICIEISPFLEAWLFGGDIRHWLSYEMGIDFDQRNSIVVGLAMGFAVIPTIFSIAEDAIFGVPKHLTNGSLALGATPWQTLWRVVLLTASPGIFSGVMIGLGRAVGETMIVLMATGNTPVMDLSIFQGMRTLSANIAVEMPESELNSTHYRVLFLAALLLFMFTFLFNTIAEVIRQRLRKKYSTL